MSTEFRPFLVLLTNFIVGVLVAEGYVDPQNASAATQQSADVVGLLIILATSIFSMHKFVHLHPVKGEPVKTQTTVEDHKTETTSIIPPTESIPVSNPNPGLPD